MLFLPVNCILILLLSYLVAQVLLSSSDIIIINYNIINIIINLKTSTRQGKQKPLLVDGACIHAYTPICIHKRMHAYINICMHACMNMCMHACIHKHLHACMHRHLRACMHEQLHACMHACMHEQLHECMCMDLVCLILWCLQSLLAKKNLTQFFH